MHSQNHLRQEPGYATGTQRNHAASFSENSGAGLENPGLFVQSSDHCADVENGSDKNDERRMPYIGRVFSYQPGHRIDVGYILDLHEDLYLSHHMFINAQGIKPPSACLPVLPMTFGLEMMAEVAACLAPGFGLIGFEKVSASQWVDLKDTTTLSLKISAQFVSEHSDLQTRRVKVEIFKEGATVPAMGCHVVLGKHYLLSVHLKFEELVHPRPLPVTVEQLYGERFLFHGPLLHCISGVKGLGDNGLIGEVTLFETKGLFRSTKKPELLTHPSFMDGVAQLLGVWFIEREVQVLPVGIEKIEMYRPVPQPGLRVPVYLQIRDISYKTVSADLEIHDGAGNVWMRIKNWTYWIFNSTQKMTDYLRLPQRYLASKKRELAQLPDGVVGWEINRKELRDLNLEWCARTALHKDEMEAFKKLKRDVPMQRKWLLERIAAKDAVRHWLANETSTEMIHPASFSFEDDGNGGLLIKKHPDISVVPEVSIAGSKDHAIAIVHKERIDIDSDILE